MNGAVLTTARRVGRAWARHLGPSGQTRKVEELPCLGLPLRGRRYFPGLLQRQAGEAAAGGELSTRGGEAVAEVGWRVGSKKHQKRLGG